MVRKYFFVLKRQVKAPYYPSFVNSDIDQIKNILDYIFYDDIMKHSVPCNLFAKIQTSDNDTYFKAIELCC